MLKPAVQKEYDVLLKNCPELSVCADAILGAYNGLISCYDRGGKVLCCGNGGSAADAEHIVGELMKGFKLPRVLPTAEAKAFADKFDADGAFMVKNLQKALPAVSLVSSSAITTAFANDVAPDMVFAQLVYGYARPGDVFIGLTTSGNSKNILYAAMAARVSGAFVVGMTGETGGALAPLCDAAIKVPSRETFRIQEYHLPVYHALCSMVEIHYFGEGAESV